MRGRHLRKSSAAWPPGWVGFTQSPSRWTGVVFGRHSRASLRDGWSLWMAASSSGSPAVEFFLVQKMWSCWLHRADPPHLPSWYRDILQPSGKQLEWEEFYLFFHLQAWGYNPHLVRGGLPVPGSEGAAASSGKLEVSRGPVRVFHLDRTPPVDRYQLVSINLLLLNPDCTVNILSPL